MRFFVFCFIATHSTDTTITLTVQQQHECVGHLFWLWLKLAAGFSFDFCAAFKTFATRSKCENTITRKMRTNGNMHNVKQASNTHTIHAERRISCDVVGVSKKTWHMQCSTAGCTLIPVISSTNGEKKLSGW